MHSDRKCLSVGDAIAIVGFLLFICGWVAAWTLITELQPTDAEASHWIVDAAYIMVVVYPPVWAFRRIKEITATVSA